MSASSLWVTWGTFSHDRCRNGPDSFLIRGRGTVSTGPNLEKSWAGISGMPAPAGAAAGAALAGPRTAASRSSLRIRPFVAAALDGVEVDVELAGQPPHAGAGVGPGDVGDRPGRGGRGRGGGPGRRGAGRGPGSRGGRGWGLLLADQARRRGQRPGAVAADDHDHGALADRVADLDLDVLHLPGGGGRDVHGRLVGLQRDEGVLLGDHVARRHVHLDHRDVLVVTDVRDRDLCGCHCCLRSTQVWGGPGQLRAGLGFSGSMPYLAIALATVSAGTVPSWARAASAARATKCRSTSKNRRSLRR